MIEKKNDLNLEESVPKETQKDTIQENRDIEQNPEDKENHEISIIEPKKNRKYL